MEQNPADVDKEPKAEESQEHDENAEQPSEASEASGSSWWGGYSSWMTKAVDSVSSVAEAAKQKSNEVYGLVAKDLEEVSTTANSMVRSSSMSLKKTLELDWYYSDPCTSLTLCGDDYAGSSICTSSKIDEKSDALADQAYDSVKTSVTSAWRYAAGYATQMFTEEDLESEALLVQDTGAEPLILNRLQAQLYALATDPETFLKDAEPEDSETFQDWNCQLDKRQGEISDLMVNNPHIRKNYSALVPDQVNHNAFWTRYFFKVHLIEIQESKRQALKKRAAEAAQADEEINWDDVADLASSKDESPETASAIPDDVQDKLLKDYEKELIEAKVKKASDHLKKELKITPDKEETSSDDWEKISSGEKSPRKQSKEEEEEWVQP